MAPAAPCPACPGPPRPRCRTKRRSRRPQPPAAATAARTASAWWPITTATRAGSRAARVASGYASRGCPPISCSTLARSDRIRVPRPAARTTAPRGREAATDGPPITSSPRLQAVPPFSCDSCMISPQSRRGMTRSMRAAGVVLVACSLATIAGCDFRRPAPAPPSALVPLDDDDHLAWAESEQYVVVVRKSCRTLDLYRQGYRIRSFPAVFGLSSTGRKLYEGDHRTPS